MPRKTRMYLPDLPVHVVPGSGPTVVSIEGVPTALSICEDIWVEGTAGRSARRCYGARSARAACRSCT